MDGFKVPSTIPQDLLLIHDIIGDSIPTHSQQNSRPQLLKEEDDGDSIASSDSEAADEDEVEAELTVLKGESDGLGLEHELPSSSDSESSSSESESEDEGAQSKIKAEDDGGDDEEHGPAATSGAYFQTKNEVPEAEVAIPEIDRIEDHEYLEKVGEVMSVLPNLAIVKGLASENINRGSERALDSDTLLVFGDRKVMGYVYETFGPTTQPLYQVKFNKSYPLDPAVVTVAREVFHVPARSNFVFLNQIRALKGSDASNVNDEEPADYELDFSDDEAEAAHKRNLKRRRSDSRAGSVASSRRSTPGPSHQRDQDLEYEEGKNPYAYNGPDDFDFESGPSRPVPLPYDDPYSETYINPTPEDTGSEIKKETSSGIRGSPRRPMTGRRGQSSIHESTDQGDRGSGRGRGRGRGRGHHQHGRGPYQKRERSQSYSEGPQESTSYQSQPYSPMLPFGNSEYPSQPQVADGMWSYSFQHAQPGMFSMPPLNPLNQGFVQPHINPRFAAAFGMNLAAGQSQTYGLAPGAPSPNLSSGSAQWQNSWQAPNQDNRHDGTYPPT